MFTFLYILFLPKVDGVRIPAEASSNSSTTSTLNNENNATAPPDTNESPVPSDSVDSSSGSQDDNAPHVRTDVVAYKNTPTPENPCNLVVPNALYQVLFYFDSHFFHRCLMR